MAYSLRSALTSLWVLILIMSFSIGAILIGVVRQGVSAHIDEAAARTRAGLRGHQRLLRAILCERDTSNRLILPGDYRT